MIQIYKHQHSSRHDGPGKRTVIWFSGCSLGCVGCINKQLWPSTSGQARAFSDVRGWLDEGRRRGDHGVTLLGGEPTEQPEALAEICSYVTQTWKALNSVPRLILYSGYTLEELVARKDGHILKALRLADVLVDGRFVIGEREDNLGYRGSRNQRVIDLVVWRERQEIRLLDHDWDTARIIVLPGGKGIMTPAMARRLGIHAQAERHCGGAA